MAEAEEHTNQRLRAAVIDCGTNMFTMLVAEGDLAHWSPKAVLRNPVFIGQGGFRNRHINPDRLARGLDALGIFHQALQNYSVDAVRVLGTSALRDASNTGDFVERVRSRFDWQLEIVDGRTEAQWIHDGVALTMNDRLERALVMDIGGGSVEFIATQRFAEGWKAESLVSLDAGVARLEEFGKPLDPLTHEGIDRYRDFLDETMQPVLEIIEQHQPQALIGSSGSFDTFSEILNGPLPVPASTAYRSLQPIGRDALRRLHERLISLPLNERLNIPGMSPARARMIPLSSMLVDHVLGSLGPDVEIYRSPFAMREGVMDSIWQHLCNR